MSDKEQVNSNKRVTPEKEENKAPPPFSGPCYGSSTAPTPTEPGAPIFTFQPIQTSSKKKKKTSPTSSSSSSSSAGDYGLHWDQFGEFGSGLASKPLTGAHDAVLFCDEKVPAELVAAGRRLLDALTPPSTVDDDKQNINEEEDKEEGDQGEKKLEVKIAPELLSPLQVVVGQWREDIEAGRHRTKVVEACAEAIGIEASLTARVYRADGTLSKAGTDEEPQVDRFELTFLDWGEPRQYIFVVDKAERRFVFVGKDVSSPHCGTNEFIYETEDGSGPGLFDRCPAPDKHERQPTPVILLAAARKRFLDYCQNRYH